MFMELIIKLIISYLLGSISGSMIVGKFSGVDIRSMGSGNAGGTNAFRTMGPKFAIIVLIIDVLKGYLAVQFVSHINFIEVNFDHNLQSEILKICCGCGSVLGHVYPIFYNFKGGKGAGTMVGVLLALFPLGLLVCFLSWIVILVLSGYVGLSTIIAGIVLPIVTVLKYDGGIFSPFSIFSIIISMFIIFTHRSNIYRMILGNENRFDKIMIFRKK